MPKGGALDRWVASKDDPLLTHTTQMHASSITTDVSPLPAVHECSNCGAAFDSRNDLFRHLRSDSDAGCGQKAGLVGLETIRVALLVGYDAAAISPDDAKGTSRGNDPSSAVRFGNKIKEALEQGMQSVFKTAHIVGSSQSSIACARSDVLAQDPVCSAAGDVLIVTLKAPAMSMEDYEANLEKSVDMANEFLRKEVIDPSSETETETAAIISFTMLKSKSNSAIHAEDDCSHRTFAYLLPISWLPGGEELAKWWLTTQRQRNSFTAENPPPQPTLQLIKNALKSAECPVYQNRRMRKRANTRVDPNVMRRPKPGRPGAVSPKERRPWHNYSAPSLAGAASPNHGVCWKVLERARLGLILNHRDGEEVVLVVEFRGDEFAQEQVRRIVGTAVAVAHGWLPDDFLSTSTRSDACVETPLAPAGRMYLSNLRFQGRGGDVIQWPKEAEAKRAEWTNSLQHQILDRLAEGSVAAAETCWLKELQTIVSPRIKKQLLCSSQVACNLLGKSLPNDKMHADAQVPAEYETTLMLLRDIVSSGRWPRTSIARSKVIRQQPQTRSNGPPPGSFTVVNRSFHILLDSPTSAAGFDLPQANRLFPELAESIFKLEALVANNGIKRPASSHCAVNCCASFTPHVDSGQGAGQSLSMIVGLGDYGGGELLVEGRPHDVRYTPMEFDGWRERHWTAPFEGERFSLVFFTPKLDRSGTTAKD